MTATPPRTSPRPVSPPKLIFSPAAPAPAPAARAPSRDPAIRDAQLLSAYHQMAHRTAALTRLFAAPQPRCLSPRMDLCDDPASARVVATLELPGLRRDELVLRVHGAALLVSGRRVRRVPNPVPASTATAAPDSTAAAAEQRRVRFPVHELKYGVFRRAIPLPAGVRPADIAAFMTDGLLTVSWPRAPAAAPLPDAGAALDAGPAEARGGGAERCHDHDARDSPQDLPQDLAERPDALVALADPADSMATD